MERVEKALYRLNTLELVAEHHFPLQRLDARAAFAVTLLYLISMLSLPLTALSNLLLYAVYPILLSSGAGTKYDSIFRQSLAVLPFLLFIGIFNPWYDHRVHFYVNNIPVTAGWLSFFSIIIRGLFSVQAVLLLIRITGFHRLCLGMRRMGVPAFFSSQLLFVYRYLFVLLQEALSMQRARAARSYGRRSYPLKMWGIFAGQLLIRTANRAERIHRAMLARGFTGAIPLSHPLVWRKKDTLYLVGWVLLFIALRWAVPPNFFSFFFTS